MVCRAPRRLSASPSGPAAADRRRSDLRAPTRNGRVGLVSRCHHRLAVARAVPLPPSRSQPHPVDAKPTWSFASDDYRPVGALQAATINFPDQWRAPASQPVTAGDIKRQSGQSPSSPPLGTTSDSPGTSAGGFRILKTLRRGARTTGARAFMFPRNVPVAGAPHDWRRPLEVPHLRRGPGRRHTTSERAIERPVVVG